MSEPQARDHVEQGMLPLDVARATVRATPGPAARTTAAAEVDPVAQVLLEVPLAHLDRPFDYLVSQEQSEAAVVGARVRVKFAGQDVDGFIVGRAAESDHPGRLQPLRRVVSAEPVLTPAIARLSEVVARRYAGTRADVLRLAVPPRHATAERQPTSSPAPARPRIDPSAWQVLAADGVLDALCSGSDPRVVATCPPGVDWSSLVAAAVAATVASGRGAVVCVPDARDVERLDHALIAALGPDQHVVLTADLGPSRRYANFLALSRGALKVAIGTRAAAYAPVRDLGLVAIWDDGDDLHQEPRAPYPHTRELLLERAVDEGCAALIAAHARSVEAQYLVRTGWASEAVAPREELRKRVRVNVTGDTDRDLEHDPFARQSRMPREVHGVIAEALQTGPVLVQTPRAGYLTRLACDRCRTPARCAQCAGPLQIRSAHVAPACGWCAREEHHWRCTQCGGQGLRAPVLGEARTAEELGRAFPGVTVRSSSASRVLAGVDERPAIVVATTGAEPVACAGYTAVVLLDTWLLLARADLRAAEEAVRRWFNAAALVRPGGRVLAVGLAQTPALQSLVRWDPAGFAQREMVERQSAHLPPASRMATVTGEEQTVAEALAAVVWPQGTEVLGPVPIEGDDQVRFVVRTPRGRGAELSAALRAMQAQRSARKSPHLRVEVDPDELG